MTQQTLPIKNQELRTIAFTHRSFLNENPDVTEHNERLEYLGDAVLELAVSEFLYTKFPKSPEGDLTAYRAALVRTNTLAEVAKALDFGDLLMLSKGEEISGGRDNTSLLANTFEAVIGAIYLDSGFSTVVAFLKEHLYPKIGSIIEKGLFKDYKSTLQEVVQAKGHESPEYELVEAVGPDHDKRFVMAVFVDGKKMGEGSGKSKQSAQQKAAEQALEKHLST